MRKHLFAFTFSISFFFFGCIGHEHYTADLEISEDPVESGKPVNFTFQIKNPQGENVSELEIVHEKPMHLFMVSQDLSQYFHEHPEKQADGTYKLPFTFPNGGIFKIFIDFKPPDDEQTVESFDVEVKGDKPAGVELKPATVFEQTVDGLLVKMKPGGELIKQRDIMLNFQAFDAETDKPVADLQNYLGEKAHFVIIRKGLGRFVHAHPMPADKMSEMDNEMGDRDSKVTAMTNFPNSGIYKIFAQFKRNDKVITIPFVFDVK